MFVAILLVCSLETKSCEVVSQKQMLKTEEQCYTQLALGMDYFEKLGYEVPVYRCVQLIENYEKT
jgi:hypothetical protein